MGRREKLLGFGLVFTGTALFASKAIFIKLAYADNPDSLLMLVWRMIFSMPLFIATGAFALRFRGGARKLAANRRLAVKACLAGLVGYYLAMALDFESLVHVSAQLERLALFTYPIFLFILGAAFFGEKLTLGHAVSALLTYTGLAFVFIDDWSVSSGNVVLGTALAIGAAISFAVYQLMAKPIITAIGSLLFTSIALTSASIASLAHFIVVRGLNFDATPRFLALAAATAVIATVIPSYFVNAGMGRIGASSTAMISTLSPLVTIVFAVLLLGERFGLTDAAGTLLILIGVGYHSWRELRAAGVQTVESNAT